MKLPWVVPVVLSVLLAAGACNRSPENAVEGDSIQPSAAPAGTSGTVNDPSEPGQASAPAQDVDAGLPDTASPLVLVGAIGLVSLAGAAALRAIRR